MRFKSGGPQGKIKNAERFAVTIATAAHGAPGPGVQEPKEWVNHGWEKGHPVGGPPCKWGEQQPLREPQRGQARPATGGHMALAKEASGTVMAGYQALDGHGPWGKFILTAMPQVIPKWQNTRLLGTDTMYGVSYKTVLKAALKSEPPDTTGLSTLVATPAPQGPLDRPGELCNVSFEDTRVSLVVAYSLACALGLPANCLTAGLTLPQVLQGSVLSVYLLCLALCELLYLGTLPLWVIYIHNQHRWTLGPWACQVTAYIFFCHVYVSVLLLCCVSCDRFTAVVYALESRGHRCQRTAAVICGCVFLLVGLVHYPVFDLEPVGELCFEPLWVNARISAYHYARFIIGFAVPLGIVSFTNHRIFRSVELSEGLTTAQKAKVKHSAIAVVAIFLLCFSPYHVVLLVRAAAFSFHRGDRDALCALEGRLYTVTVAFLCLSTVNSVADPIIYALTTDRSRQEVSRLYQGWKRRTTRIGAARLTPSQALEGPRSPMTLTNNCARPSPVQASRAQP
ncbi:putative G-protein coupled receptor 132 [Thomomys bottae]